MPRYVPKAPRFAANVESLLVGKADSGLALQDFLAARLGLSRRTAKAVIDGRSVWVNRRCVWIARHKLATRDVVELPRAVAAAAKRQSAASGAATAPEPKRPGTVPERRHVRVLLTTEHYVVADKPSGCLVCGDPQSVEAILRAQLGEPNLQAVHRLDRDTTGCLLFAKDFAAHEAAVEVFKTHRVQKTYHAIAVGRFPHPFETIDAPIDGERALSRIVREAVSPDASFLRVKIETGRTNQIRRHLASIRFPVAGDRTFGLKNARDPRFMTLPRQMLHASSLALPDPLTPRAEIKAHSPLPADFRAALKLFGMGKR